MVKALKGDPINGYFYLKVGSQNRRYSQANIDEFLARIPRALWKMIQRKIDGQASLVPIPNSHVTDVNDDNFKTLGLATDVARHSGGQLIVLPALVFEKPQSKSREGGPRSPSHFEAAYRLTKDVSGPIVLLDDVYTSGSHIIGAYRKLNSPPKRNVVLSCAFGRASKNKMENPVGLREETLHV
jgi:predicted amidophosphoribosyltransferase